MVWRVAASLQPRGVVETPVFMPVGTAATVKGMMPILLLPLAHKLFWPILITDVAPRC